MNFVRNWKTRNGSKANREEENYLCLFRYFTTTYQLQSRITYSKANVNDELGGTWKRRRPILRQ